MNSNKNYKIGLAVSQFYPDFARELVRGVDQFFTEKNLIQKESSDRNQEAQKNSEHSSKNPLLKIFTLDSTVMSAKSNYQLIQASSPGSTELPLLADRLFQKCHAVIALGVVIRGETSHYDSVCAMVEQGIIQVQLKHSKPLINGVIMAENKDQVQKRLSREKHIGYISARACWTLLESLEKI